MPQQNNGNKRDNAAPRSGLGADYTRGKKGRGAKWVPAALLLGLVALALGVWALVRLMGGGGDTPVSAPGSGPAAVVSQPAIQPGGDAASVPAPQSVAPPNTDDAGAAYLESIVYLGDSNTKNLIDYGLAPAERVLAEPNIGIDSVLTYAYASVAGVEGYITVPEAVGVLQPARVMMTYGTNDTELYAPEAFTARYAETVAAIRAASPDTVIIVNAVPPVGPGSSYAEKVPAIAAFNAALAEMCAAEGLFFLDSTEALAGEDGLLLEAYRDTDNFHLNGAGLAALLEYAAGHQAA